MTIDQNHTLVIGARRTGTAVARFLSGRGSRVRLSDRAGQDEASVKAAIGSTAVELRLGEDGEELLEGIDLVVPSPGVPRTSPLLREATARGIPVLAEIELASRYLDVPILAITGTNGKSTTTAIAGEMLRCAGRHPFIGGNLGTPLIEAPGTAIDVAVVEVSSFQLEWIDRFRPSVGVFLNVTPDHLDRYESFEDYARAKAALFRNQTNEDWAILSREDARVWELRGTLRGRVISFGFEGVELGAFPLDGTIVFRVPGQGSGEHTISLARSNLRGLHNLENTMAAGLAALALGASPEGLQEAIDRFEGLPHRLVVVRETRGITWIDDSKGTNVGAVVKSVASVDAPVILLAGGLGKGTSFEPLRDIVMERVKCVVAFGSARGEISRDLAGATRVVEAGGLEEAVRRANDVARSGDTVLLSPACASFDEFRDYAERGTRFREIVETL